MEGGRGEIQGGGGGKGGGEVRREEERGEMVHLYYTFH